MYCSACGASVANNLIYCNQCGAKLGGAKDDGGKASDISPNSLIWAMVAIFVIGMAAITAGLTGMKKYGFDIAMISTFLVFIFGLMVSLEGVFVWLLLKGRKVVEKESSQPKQLNEQARKELYEAPARAFTEPVSSVVEPTTNRLEPVYREQKSK
jgi:hypothetical protein